MDTYRKKSFSKPDETRQFRNNGKLDVLDFGEEFNIGRAEFEPGWKWSTDVAPIAGTESCMAAHRGYVVSGSMVIKMDNGEEFKVTEGEAFTVEPGHDAWVEGNERCVVLDFGGFKEYAKEKTEKKVA